MAANKTQATDASVDTYLLSIGDEARRNDCIALVVLMSRVTEALPTMWGSSIVGFGSYHYVYESGREGDAPLTGFSSRARELVIYLGAPGNDQLALLTRLGKHRMGKGCLYLRKLSDVDVSVLEQLVTDGVDALKRRYGR